MNTALDYRKVAKGGLLHPVALPTTRATELGVNDGNVFVTHTHSVSPTLSFVIIVTIVVTTTGELRQD